MIKEIEFRGKMIPLREDVTIIIGPNGCGKTGLLYKIEEEYDGNMGTMISPDFVLGTIETGIPEECWFSYSGQSREILIDDEYLCIEEMCKHFDGCKTEYKVCDGTRYGSFLNNFGLGTRVLTSIMILLHFAKKYREKIIEIDTPELGMHILWQEKLVDFLVNWSHETGIQVVIATHSPHIISGHFDAIEDIS